MLKFVYDTENGIIYNEVVIEDDVTVDEMCEQFMRFYVGCAGATELPPITLETLSHLYTAGHSADSGQPFVTKDDEMILDEEDSIDEVYEQGFQAYEDGVGASYNPYRTSGDNAKYRAWMEGYLSVYTEEDYDEHEEEEDSEPEEVGMIAGLNGDPMSSNPYDTMTPDGVRWINGYLSAVLAF